MAEENGMVEKEYGFRQESYRGFYITSMHEGEDGEVTGYTATVDEEWASEEVGEEVGSIAGDFASVQEARDFIDSELGDAIIDGEAGDAVAPADAVEG